jgi:hypothetical protein
MADSGPVAFWSYSHDDNEKARDAILGLAKLICDEYSLITGEELGLFVDTRIKWGELWRERIDNELVSTTFLIPVVTPRYFTRDECLRELFEFTERAKSIGVDELVCPILYVDVPDLDEQSDDPAKALIAKARYEDWTRLRLAGPDAAEHVGAVHTVALRLDEVSKRVAERQVVREVASTEEGAKEEVDATLAETVEAIRKLLPEWTEAMEKDSVLREQFLAADRVLEKRRQKAETGPAGARFVIAARQVQEYLPIVEARAKLSRRLLSIGTELGPLVRRLMGIVKEHPEERGVAAEVWSEIDPLSDVYIEHDMSRMVGVADWARRHSHETRGMLTLAQACDRSDRLARELGQQIGEWSDQAEVLVGADDGEGANEEPTEDETGPD